jgi:hypothetical protein
VFRRVSASDGDDLVNVMRSPTLIATLVAVALGLAGCAGASKSGTPPATTTAESGMGGVSTTTPTTTSKKRASPSALQAEANSAAAGDIPDNQVFLRFRDRTARYSMKYPEGWAQRGSGAKVTFRDKNNIVRILVTSAPPPTAASIRRELHALKGAHVRSGPQSLPISGSPAFKVVYTTESARNAVTGKRVTLVVDRYYLGHAGKVAVVDLGTPQGVDNVDAYRLMIQSFRWS